MLSAALCAAVALSAQSGESPPSAISRSIALGNDASLPVSASASAAFAAGDEAPAGAQAFDSWWRAVQSSTSGEAVRVLGTEHTARAPTEGVECALLRRLRALSATERAAWRARFEPLATRALEQAGDDLRALALVERNFAGTRAAVIGALRAGDGEHEAGRTAAARVWWSRAMDQLALITPHDSALDAALLLRAKSNSSSELEALLFDERALREVLNLDLAAPDLQSGLARDREPGAGLAELADGRIVVQVSERFVLIDAHGAWRAVEPHSLLDGPEWSWPPAYRDLEQAWPQRPLAIGNRIVAVLGRARAEHGNALACFDPGGEGVPPHLVWAWTAAGWIGPEGLSGTSNEANFEFEPGPLLEDGRVLVAAHRLGARIQQELLVLDADDGRLLRRIELGQAADPRANDRPNLPPEARPSGPPGGLLGLAEGRVLVPSGLGFAALVEACDGRVLWSVRAARAGAGVLAGTLPAAPELSAPPQHWRWAPPEAAEELSLPAQAAGDALELAGARSTAHQGKFGWLGHFVPGSDSVALGTGEHAQAALALGPTHFALVTERALQVFSSDGGRLVLRRELGGERPPSPGAGQLVLLHGRLLFADPRRVRAWSLH